MLRSGVFVCLLFIINKELLTIMDITQKLQVLAIALEEKGYNYDKQKGKYKKRIRYYI